MLTGGGTDDQCLRLAHGLAARGHEVWVAAPDGRELTPRVRELGLPWRPTAREGPLKLGFIRSVARACRELNIGIVHGHHGRDLWPAILAARWSGVRPRVVLTRHLAKSPSSWVSRRFLLFHCDRLIAVSEFVARVLREGVYEPESPVEERRARPPLLGDLSRVVVAQGGIDPQRFQPLDAAAQRGAWGLEPHHVAFGVVGGYDLPRGKGQREFLQAAAAIRARVPAARFVIIGRGNMADLLRADIERLGLTGTAFLAPYCHDMPRAMNALDCLVHPQVATDAFPTVILEAMACNRPVIATACDGAPEQFTDGVHGLLVPMENPAALGAAMERVGADEALRRRLGDDGRRHVLSRFTLDHLADRVQAIYAGLSAPTNAPRRP